MLGERILEVFFFIFFFFGWADVILNWGALPSRSLL